MTEETDDSDMVAVERLPLAAAVDLLREYETELSNAGADEGPYTREVRVTIDRLEAALEDRGAAQSSNGEG